MGQAKASTDLALLSCFSSRSSPVSLHVLRQLGVGTAQLHKQKAEAVVIKERRKSTAGSRPPSPLAGQAVTHLRAADLGTMDAGDGIYEVVGLINDHNLVLQLDPGSVPGRLMQKHLIGQHHQLQEKHTLP